MNDPIHCDDCNKEVDPDVEVNAHKFQSGVMGESLELDYTIRCPECGVVIRQGRERIEVR